MFCPVSLKYNLLYKQWFIGPISGVSWFTQGKLSTVLRSKRKKTLTLDLTLTIMPASVTSPHSRVICRDVKVFAVLSFFTAVTCSYHYRKIQAKERYV